jgi:hypothetical protein
MADLSEQWLGQMPEIGILRDVARAAGESIRIRGGVPRNLLARAVRAEGVNTGGPEHLIDLVDPLSDIDIVMSTTDKTAFVLGLIFQRIALAGFTRWEGKTKEQVAHFEAVGAMSNLDGVEIEVTPKGAHVVRADAALRDLQDRRVRGRLPPESTQVPREMTDIDEILFALRLERFAAQFDLEVDQELGNSISTQRKIRLISPLDLLRIEFAALDVLLTASSPTWAEEGLRRVRQIVPPSVRHQSRILIQLEDVRLTEPLRVIAYPRLGTRAPRARLETHVTQNSALAKEPTLLPWTAIRLPPFPQGACCPPDDFTLGPLVIAWRGQQLTQGRIGVVALAPAGDPYDAASSLVFGVPGIVTAGPSVVQRLDWGFARYIAGDGRLVYFGAREALTASSSEVSQ